MKPKRVLFFLWTVMLSILPSRSGTWSDHFSFATLLNEWNGHREDFRIVNQVLEGVSASPVAPSPFNFVEIQKDSTDCTVSAWINVVAPNVRVCTKGAIVARHSGTNGYVFALHEATQTAEIYRLENHEMLLSKAWKIDLRTWYFARVELHGPNMSFFIDGQEVGAVTDSVSPSGAVGLAVQDAEPVWFDDFTLSGPGVEGNVDDVPKPEISSVESGAGGVTLRFKISGAYDYYVQVSSSPEPSHDWQTVATYGSKSGAQDIVFTDTNTTGMRFYRIEKTPCYCR